MIGRTIGTYTITGALGSGGMGEVFVGEDLMLERQVAIKQLRPELASRPDVVQRFRSEAVVLARLHHTNIATVYAFLQESANFFLVMEYVQGWTLQHVIESRGALAPTVAVGLCQQALDGIGFAHRHQIIHRDLKPANVMLTQGGVVKVMDFGLARVLDTSRLTPIGRLVGTLEYISPEQIRGEETDARSDIYSLGILLYELVTGRLPFESDSEYALLRAQVETPPPSPRQMRPVISRELEQVILRALAKNAAERFQDTEEFSHALARCIPRLDTQEALAALLTALKTTAVKAEPIPVPLPETRLALSPATASAQIKATRLANPGDRGATDLRSPSRCRVWKNVLVPALILASAIAAVGLLFVFGEWSPSREPALFSPSPEVVREGHRAGSPVDQRDESSLPETPQAPGQSGNLHLWEGKRPSSSEHGQSTDAEALSHARPDVDPKTFHPQSTPGLPAENQQDSWSAPSAREERLKEPDLHTDGQSQEVNSSTEGWQKEGELLPPKTASDVESSSLTEKKETGRKDQEKALSKNSKKPLPRKVPQEEQWRWR
jgi:serine/threonine protein kinase